MAKKKVLFVDDNPMDRLILAKTLKELRLDHLETKTPEEFLKNLKSYEPDLCLVDLNISQNNDGEVLVKAIRNILGPDLPVIIISALEEDDKIEENIKIGANDFICKPIDKALLSSKISNFLSSDVLNSNALPLFKVPKNEDSLCEIEIEANFEKISESGIQFSSNYIVKEGTIIEVTDPYIDKIFNKGDSMHLTISRSWRDDDTQKIYFIGDFVDVDPEMNQAIRQFITRNINNPG